MNEEEQVPEDTSIPQDATPEVDDAPEETVEEIKARLAKAEELAKNYKIRAEKAETRVKEPVLDSTSPTLSAKDILAVSKAGLDPEDLDEVIEYANYKRIPIHEALKSPVVKATIAQQQEVRKSASAVHTSSARRTSSQVSDEQLLADARRGIFPDSDADTLRLARLRRK